MKRAAKPSRIDAFMKLIAPFGILESARTGNIIPSASYNQCPGTVATAAGTDINFVPFRVDGAASFSSRI